MGLFKNVKAHNSHQLIKTILNNTTGGIVRIVAYSVNQIGLENTAIKLNIIKQKNCVSWRLC